MTDKKYEDVRPTISAELKRAVAVESGHCCAIKGCGEHTYLEIHHIDENRENNVLANLILLCDKHHKMAHRNVIDRKALREYKRLLSESHNTIINERFDQLERLLKEANHGQPQPTPTPDQPLDDRVRKLTPRRNDLLCFALTHVAISYFEKSNNLYFEHQVEFVRGEDRLLLDAIRQDDDLDKDIIIDVQYLRKSYMDAPAYGAWLEKKIELYELLTGRPARGVLLVVVGRESMKDEGRLPLTRRGVSSCTKDITLHVCSCEDVGFHPGSASAALFASNLEKANNESHQDV